MEIKKSPKANLEKFKILFVAMSFILSLGAIIYAFEKQSSTEVVSFASEEVEAEEEMLITRQDEKIEPPEQPKEQQQQQTLEIIDIVEDNADIEEQDFNFEEYSEDDEVDIEEEEEVEEDKIFIHVKNMPEFPGGTLALRKWIGKHVNYPAVARENGIQGTVYLRFEVKKNGQVGQVQMQKGVDPLLDDEAKKVIQSLPKFKPGEQNGRKVRVWFSIPVTFKLS